MSTITAAAAPGPNIQEQCNTRLGHILEKHPSIFFISLASVDGRSYAHLDRNRTIDPQRVAAMTSSLLGLSSSYAREVSGHNCRYSVVAMDGGSIITVRIPTKSLRFALSVGASDSESLATILRAALDGAAQMARLLG